jgi:L-ascorbate metabolism protein UlaG (beta-lactamase superfamily)
MRDATRYSAAIISAIFLALVLATFGPLGAQSGKIEVLWLGQAATRITSVGGKVIVIDPFLTQNPKTPAQNKNLDALGKVDLILVTYAHGDHLGDGPDLAKKHKAPLWGPAGLDQSLLTLGVLPAELAPRMNKGGVITPLGPDIKITMTRAEHSSELVWTNPATGKPETHVGGEPGGFIIEFENGFTLYHMGDTGVFADMKWIGEYDKPDLIMIPIGGHFVMSPKDAAAATEMIKPKFSIPHPLRDVPDAQGHAPGVHPGARHHLGQGVPDQPRRQADVLGARGRREEAPEQVAHLDAVPLARPEGEADRLAARPDEERGGQGGDAPRARGTLVAVEQDRERQAQP